ncbi:helix-turn-helix transcriptional regulator [Wohlfahrtiimonas larvae]|nr:PAS domain-containing protein [Wohlfahrtiimonas larvae]
MKAQKDKLQIFKKKFSKKDHECLQSYFNLAETIADLIGAHCEVVIHSFENIDRSVVKIINGHHTGRTLNSPVTNLGLKMLRQYEQTGECVSKSYFTNAKNGGLMKSTTCILKNHSDEAIGMFCININLSVPFPEVIQTLMPMDNPTVIGMQQPENFSTNAKEVIEKAIAHAEQEVDAMQSSLKNRNKNIIRVLHENGIFELKEATIIVAEALQITRHAVYKNIRQFQSETKSVTK